MISVISFYTRVDLTNMRPISIWKDMNHINAKNSEYIMSMEKFYFFITIFLCDDRKLFALFWYFNFVISFIEKSKFNIYIYIHIYTYHSIYSNFLINLSFFICSQVIQINHSIYSKIFLLFGFFINFYSIYFFYIHSIFDWYFSNMSVKYF